MMRRILASLLLVTWSVLLALAGAGCAKRHHISIESNTCWLATIDQLQSSAVTECGNVNYRVSGDLHCASVRNLNDTGYVRIRIDEGTWAESTAPRGTAAVCR